MLEEDDNNGLLTSDKLLPFRWVGQKHPVNALSQHLNFPRQAGSDLGFRLRPFGFFLSRLNSNKGTKCDIEIRAARTFAGGSRLQFMSRLAPPLFRTGY
jgi:hypothetical protein